MPPCPYCPPSEGCTTTFSSWQLRRKHIARWHRAELIAERERLEDEKREKAGAGEARETTVAEKENTSVGATKAGQRAKRGLGDAVTAATALGSSVAPEQMVREPRPRISASRSDSSYAKMARVDEGFRLAEGRSL